MLVAASKAVDGRTDELDVLARRLTGGEVSQRGLTLTFSFNLFKYASVQHSLDQCGTKGPRMLAFIKMNLL